MTDQSHHKGDILTLVSFSLGNQKLAIPATDLREILDPIPATRVPGTGSFAPWVLNVRGAVLPLANLRIPLGIQESRAEETTEDTRRIMVLEVEIGGEPAAVAIDADVVHEVALVQRDRIETVPPTSQWPTEFLSGIFKGDEGDFIIVPDLSTIFTAMAERAVA